MVRHIVSWNFKPELSEEERQAAREALNGSDPSGGAIYYFNPATSTSSWSALGSIQSSLSRKNRYLPRATAMPPLRAEASPPFSLCTTWIWGWTAAY